MLVEVSVVGSSRQWGRLGVGRVLAAGLLRARGLGFRELLIAAVVAAAVEAASVVAVPPYAVQDLPQVPPGFGAAVDQVVVVLVADWEAALLVGRAGVEQKGPVGALVAVPTVAVADLAVGAERILVAPVLVLVVVVLVLAAVVVAFLAPADPSGPAEVRGGWLADPSGPVEMWELRWWRVLTSLLWGSRCQFGQAGWIPVAGVVSGPQRVVVGRGQQLAPKEQGRVDQWLFGEDGWPQGEWRKKQAVLLVVVVVVRRWWVGENLGAEWEWQVSWVASVALAASVASVALAALAALVALVASAASAASVGMKYQLPQASEQRQKLKQKRGQTAAPK